MADAAVSSVCARLSSSRGLASVFTCMCVYVGGCWRACGRVCPYLCFGVFCVLVFLCVSTHGFAWARGFVWVCTGSVHGRVLFFSCVVSLLVCEGVCGSVHEWVCSCEELCCLHACCVSTGLYVSL